MKAFVVIGLGRFGNTVTTELNPLDHRVLAADGREDRVQRVAEKVTYAVTGDARDPSVLRALGVRSYDCVIVAMEDDIRDPALITPNLREIGVKRVICKVQSHIHRRVLKKIGADRVVFPEHKMGVELAQGLPSSNVLNFIELSEDFGVAEAVMPEKQHYETIQNPDVRARCKVNIIAMRRDKDGALNMAPGTSYVIEPSDAAVALGRTEGISHLQDL